MCEEGIAIVSESASLPRKLQGTSEGAGTLRATSRTKKCPMRQNSHGEIELIDDLRKSRRRPHHESLRKGRPDQ